MKTIYIAIIAFVLTATNIFAAPVLTLIPYPKSINISRGEMVIKAKNYINYNDDQLLPLAQVLKDEIKKITGMDLRIKKKNQSSLSGDIMLSLNPNIKAGNHEVSVNKNAVIKGASYQDVAMGSVNIIQTLNQKKGKWTVPRFTSKDSPSKDYRGLMIDVARRNNSIDQLKQCVILCRLYKVNYMPLHLTDDHAWTFPSTKFPKLGSANRGFRGPIPKVYDLQELKDLVKFADARGVTLIPELDAPAHTGALRVPYPEVFDANDGRPAYLGLLNMASDEVYPALEILVKEMLDVFQSSPYFHIGGDEADTSRAKLAPSYEPFMKKHKLNSPHELFVYFLNRMNAVVKKHGCQSLIWSDVGGSEIDKDIIPMCWRNDSTSAKSHTKEGYKIINAIWNPLYVVNQTFPTLNIVEDGREKHRPESIYNWKLNQFDNKKLSGTSDIIGAQMCSWESGGEVQLTAMRSRLPAMSEKIWDLDAEYAFTNFISRYQVINPKIDALVSGLVTEENLVELEKLKYSGPILPDMTAEQSKYFADPYNPPFQLSPEARQKRAKQYTIKKIDFKNVDASQSFAFFGDQLLKDTGVVEWIGKAISSQIKTKAKIKNFSNRGAVVKDILNGFRGKKELAFTAIIKKEQPNTVVLCIGNNDASNSKIQASAYESLLKESLETAKDLDIKHFVLVTPWLDGELPNRQNPHDTKLREFSTICHKLAQNDYSPMQLSFVDLYGNTMLYLQNNNCEQNDANMLEFKDKGILTSDGKKPNRKGITFISKQILSGISKAYSKPQD